MSSWKIPIIHQSADWLCIDKPAGLSVHNTDAAENLLSVLARLVPGPLHLVHRLDKPTSGLLLIARSSQQAALLQQALAGAQKSYQAIIRGRLAKPAGRWSQSLSNKAEGRRNPRGKARQRVSAQTEYRVLERNTYLTRLACTLHTGRQHQIRKHAALNGHEILGDSRYGDPRYQQKMSNRFGAIPLCLRATELNLKLNGQAVQLQAPPADDWQRFAV